MAAGNTFGATALSSYGGFWLSFAIVLTPGGFGIMDAYSESEDPNAFDQAFSFFLFVCNLQPLGSNANSARDGLFSLSSSGSAH